MGSFVVCGDRQLLFEEAPSAYKRIEQVIADLQQHGLATPVAATVPLVTYKTADGGKPRGKR
jgi:release factor H-coupled RctB family protein